MIGAAAGAAAGTVASDALSGIASAIQSGVSWIVTSSITWWVKVPSPDLAAQPAVSRLQQWMLPLAAAVAVLGLIIAGGKMALTRKANPLIDVGSGLVIIAATSAVGVLLPSLLLQAGDAWSDWVLNASAGGQFASRLTTLLSLTGAAPAVVVVLGVIAILISAVQAILMLFRQASLVILAGVLPLAAAGTLTPATRTWFKKITGWELALIFYKPAAAAVYAAAFTMAGTGTGRALHPDGLRDGGPVAAGPAGLDPAVHLDHRDHQRVRRGQRVPADRLVGHGGARRPARLLRRVRRGRAGPPDLRPARPGRQRPVRRAGARHRGPPGSRSGASHQLPARRIRQRAAGATSGAAAASAGARTGAAPGAAAGAAPAAAGGPAGLAVAGLAAGAATARRKATEAMQPPAAGGGQ